MRPTTRRSAPHMLNDASKGSVRSVTVRAFNRDEMLRIIDKVSAVKEAAAPGAGDPAA